jgi:hypothetical protein
MNIYGVTSRITTQKCFISSDGKIFLNEKDCINHETKIYMGYIKVKGYTCRMCFYCEGGNCYNGIDENGERLSTGFSKKKADKLCPGFRRG